MILARKIITFFKIKFSRHWKVAYYEVCPQPNYKELWNRLYNAQKDIAKNGDSKEKRYLAKGQVKLMDDLVKELDL